MGKIFIYYSLTGNGDYVSLEMEKKGYVLRKVEEKKKMPKKFLFRILAGGFRAGVGAKAKLVDFNNDISMFSDVVIGSPVWNGRFPPVINSVLSEINLENKNLTFLFYSGSGTIPKVNKKIEKLYPTAKVVVLKEPQKHPDELSKISEI